MLLENHENHQIQAWILELYSLAPTFFKPPLGLPCRLSLTLLSRELVELAIGNAKWLLVCIRSSLQGHGRVSQPIVCAQCSMTHRGDFNG